MNERAFRIKGLDCAEEAAALKRAVAPLVGGENRLRFDILNAKMIVSGTAAEGGAIMDAVARTGMTACPWQDRFAQGDESAWRRHGRALMTASSGTLSLVGISLHWMIHGSVLEALAGTSGEATHVMPRWAIAAYAAAIVCGTWYVVPRALRALRGFRADMNLLMAVAVAGAIVLGEWAEAAMVAFLFSLALFLEQWSVSRARHAVSALLDLSPAMARVLEANGAEKEKRVEDVRPGEIVLVREGEKIPVDGLVAKGMSSVNQAPITGEAAPLHKGPGDDVFAGTLNENGTLEVRVSREASDTTLARIIRMVEEARSRRAAAERWVDRFARVYTPLMMALSAALVIIPPAILGGDWARWFYQGLVILVIACPCALVISTPVSIVAALTSAARQGVLIKGGAYLETAGSLKSIAFDKTGTLTYGRPDVQTIVPFGGYAVEDVLSRAMAIESHSNHPTARAILRRGNEMGLDIRRAESFRALPGEGAEAVIDGESFWIGSHRLMEERGEETAEIHEKALALEDAGHSVVALGDDTHVRGLISVADGVREQSAATVAALKAIGIAHICMLTGDNDGTARAVASATGVDEYRCALLPKDKVRAVQDLERRHGPVAMVGDGVNDAPAMATSALGIAMGAIGTDAAIESSDVALMSDDLSKLPWLVRHSRRALQTVRQNIGFALTVKAVFIALALAGIATLWMAIAADMGASLLVIANSLRLLRAKGRQ